MNGDLDAVVYMYWYLWIKSKNFHPTQIFILKICYLGLQCIYKQYYVFIIIKKISLVETLSSDESSHVYLHITICI